MNSKTNNEIAFNIFTIGEIVLAKQKFYPPWPALILEMHQTKRNVARVQFFGWNQSWAYVHFNSLQKQIYFEGVKEKYKKNVTLMRAFGEVDVCTKMLQHSSNNSDLNNNMLKTAIVPNIGHCMKNGAQSAAKEKHLNRGSDVNNNELKSAFVPNMGHCMKNEIQSEAEEKHLNRGRVTRSAAKIIATSVTVLDPKSNSSENLNVLNRARVTRSAAKTMNNSLSILESMSSTPQYTKKTNTFAGKQNARKVAIVEKEKEADHSNIVRSTRSQTKRKASTEAPRVTRSSKKKCHQF